MQRERQTRPDEKVGKFCVVAGCAMVLLAVFLPQLDFGERCFAAAGGLIGWSWGSKEVAAAKKWRQEGRSDDAPSYRFVIPKAILLVVLGILLFALAIVVRFAWFNR